MIEVLVIIFSTIIFQGYSVQLAEVHEESL